MLYLTFLSLPSALQPPLPLTGSGNPGPESWWPSTLSNWPSLGGAKWISDSSAHHCQLKQSIIHQPLEIETWKATQLHLTQHPITSRFCQLCAQTMSRVFWLFFTLSVSLPSESPISQASRQGPSGNMALVTCHLQETWDGLRGGSFTLSSPTGVYIPICCDQGNLLAQWRSHLYLAQYSPKVSHHAWGKPVCSSAGMPKIGLSLLSLPLDSRCLGLPDSFPRPPLATLFYFPLKMLPASHSGRFSASSKCNAPSN